MILVFNGAIAEDYYSRKNEPANSQYIENLPNILAKSTTDTQKANAYINRGVIHYRQKNYGQAIEDYTEAIKLAPENVHAHINRGIVYIIIKEPEQAIEDNNRAIEMKPENIDAYINRGIAYSSLGDLSQAIEDYDRAIALAPNNADAYYAKGLTLAVREENKQQAIEAYSFTEIARGELPHHMPFNFHGQYFANN